MMVSSASRLAAELLGFHIPEYSPNTGDPDIPGIVCTSKNIAGNEMPPFMPPTSENSLPSFTSYPGIDDTNPVLVRGNPGPVLIPCGNPITTTFSPGSIGIFFSAILLAGTWAASGQAAGRLNGIATQSQSEPSLSCSNHEGPFLSSISILWAARYTHLRLSRSGPSLTTGSFARM